MGIDALYRIPNDFESKQEEFDSDSPKKHSPMQMKTTKTICGFRTLLNSNLSDEELEELEKANLIALEESKRDYNWQNARQRI